MTRDLPFQRDFSPAEFHARRDAVAEAIGDGVAILQGLPDPAASVTFRQHNDFYYLCGVEVPHAYLTIDGRTGKSVLYLLPRDDKLAESDGPELNSSDADTAVRLTGVDEVMSTLELLKTIPDDRTLFLCHAPAEGRQAYQDTLRHAIARAALDPTGNVAVNPLALVNGLRSQWPATEIRDLSPTLAKMRLHKSPAEIALMRRAGQLTAQAVVEAMRATRPGIFEYQLAAIADYVFLNGGARGGGYRPIVAAGRNIWNMHYFRMETPLEEGELVLMDYAPDLRYYTSDIGRIWPVSGKYSQPQRELYGFAVDYHLTLLELIGPGKTVEEISRAAAERLQPLVSRTRWSRASVRAAIDTVLDSTVAFTHTVGMAVHDGGHYKNAALQPGLVFALDPQLWIRDERHYIRVEDTVLITENGVENFTRDAPHGLDEVESTWDQQATFPGLLDRPA
jgi:Xaa-Pro aminopeptidase